MAGPPDRRSRRGSALRAARGASARAPMPGGAASLPALLDDELGDRGVGPQVFDEEDRGLRDEHVRERLVELVTATDELRLRRLVRLVLGRGRRLQDVVRALDLHVRAE